MGMSGESLRSDPKQMEGPSTHAGGGYTDPSIYLCLGDVDIVPAHASTCICICNQCIQT